VAIEIVGVVALAILASIGPKTGRVVVLFMVGLLVLWLVLNATTLAKLLPGQNVPVQGLCKMIWALFIMTLTVVLLTGVTGVVPTTKNTVVRVGRPIGILA
jgi:hypothetical protein